VTGSKTFALQHATRTEITMKLSHALTGAISAVLAVSALAQTAPPSLASSAGVMAYPAKGQDAATQSKDEGECFNWAKQQTGFDPMSPPPTATVAAAPPPPPPPSGARARGAVRGAAAGAVVGEIANNDADQGAKTGAAVGVVAGGAKNRQAKAQHQAQVDAANQQAQAAADQTNAAYAQGKESFKKGMTVCLEGRGYTVK
jgi:YMGG-like Gly-zipper